MLHRSLLLVLVLSPLLAGILAQLLVILNPVISSYLFKLLNKGTTAIASWNDWVKRIAYVVLNTLLALGVAALHLVNVPGDVTTWDVTTVEGIITGIAAILLYDNGKTAAKPDTPAP